MNWISRCLTVAASLTFLVGSAGSASAGSVLIVASDYSGAPTAELTARGFTTVDVFNSATGTPTLAQLQMYDAILAYTNYPPSSATGLGNVLADYVDAGGLLSLATYSYSTPWAITGRIATAGYAPLTNLGINGVNSGFLVATSPGDPIFSGVDLGTLAYFQNSNFARPGLDAGATLLATDGSGVNMIARSASGNVVGLNLFPSSGYGNNGEFYDLLANSLRRSDGTSVPDAGSSLLLLLGSFSGLAALRGRATRSS